MDKLIYTAMTGAKNTMSRQESVAHNLANAATAGYRAEEHRLRAVPVRSEALPTRVFVVDASVANNHAPGPIEHTGRPLDVAVAGAGWIALALPDGGEAYTRNGSFEISENGVLQTRRGVPVQGDGGPISIPPDNQITIAQDGTISAIPVTGAQNSVAVLGRIKLVNPPGDELTRGADGLFRLANGEAAESDPRVGLAAGYLEGSNVNAVDQLVAMISLARQFDLQVQMLRNAEENDRAAAQLVSGR